MAAVVVWFRKDLRLHDNPALTAAAETGQPIIPLYILDDVTPKERKMGGAQRWWLHHSLLALQHDLKKLNSDLIFKRGDPAQIFDQLRTEIDIDTVMWNRCYEPYGIKYDQVIEQRLKEQDITVHSYNGRLLFEPWTVSNKSKQFYKVFSQFWKACQQRLQDIRPLVKKPSKLNAPTKWPGSDHLESWQLLPQHPDWSKGFTECWMPGEAQAHKNLHEFLDDAITEYKEARNLPAQHGTSRLSPYLHFGEISPHQIYDALQHHFPTGLTASAERYFAEIGWREFSYHLLYHFPEFPDQAFRPEFNDFKWDDNPKAFEKWQQGQTGYPFVDAAMRELWHTGWMHNRMRMVVASFLTKDLFIDWRQGDKWFWDTLVDADLANNTAGWQWVTGCGADAAPYFRIFNPILQGKKFDTQGDYIRHWVPEIAGLPDQYIHEPWTCPDEILTEANITLGDTYPKPIVDHYEVRTIAMNRYHALKEQK